ncbi:DNA polymerase III subunit chi [Polymorphobacter megasporae]|uniref:DNA polymerase III subunit chi n=1 Tax=Glacieibacterium megasporae TaxID=2835787 RepID=UPI001C1E680D|nr:DNA polymerase III subunit chi [Polymorphobacter megasporae]UAJ09488.1 DNA polymerase III subunit chi [Polymorphobacter megasporae]
MTDVNFYQLAAKPLDAVLPRLLEKAVAAGYRAVIRAADPALLARLDAALWTYDPASFLPHAVDGPYAAAQPILLTGGDAGEGAANDADLLVVIDGVMPGELTAFRRALYLFDGADDAALGLARHHWKAIRELDGVTPVYWRETERGGWEKAA